MEMTGQAPLRRRAPGFAGLAATICGQQLSTFAAAAIWARMVAAYDEVHHDHIRTARTDRLRRFGLSAAKIKTLKFIAREIAEGRLDLAKLAEAPADEAHDTLTALHGIGPWTADIYLLFCLGHGDAWPAGDLAVQEAIRIGLGLKSRPTVKEMAVIGEAWRPYRGAAAHLFWAYYKVVKANGFDPMPPEKPATAASEEARVAPRRNRETAQRRREAQGQNLRKDARTMAADLPLLDGPRIAPRSGTAKQLVVLLHGYGADGNDLIDIGHAWRQWLPDAAFVSPDAPEPCAEAPIGRQWFTIDRSDPRGTLEGRHIGCAGRASLPRRGVEAPRPAADRAGAGRLQPGHDDRPACRLAQDHAAARHRRLFRPAHRAESDRLRGHEGRDHQPSAGAADPRRHGHGGAARFARIICTGPARFSASTRKPTCRTASAMASIRTDCSAAACFWRAHSRRTAPLEACPKPLHKHVTLLVDYTQAIASESTEDLEGSLERYLNAHVSQGGFPALVLNADFRPLSYYPLSLWSWQDAIKAVFLDRVNIVANYDHAVRSPSFEMQLPSVVSLKSFVKPTTHPAFTRFNVFLRDKFSCQYCGDDSRTSPSTTSFRARRAATPPGKTSSPPARPAICARAT